ncbi:unnamed protein product [Microthlaspi erraticum]|uniref:Replication protein A 70 kDa DNA-binding subunit B/D first OB fold domain-containing protein n=1 Tax=Microthlaspi erraticum TaxID=1685480 RepID=A0A6D2LE90_9BRAS|nr:unnamed protein product [Microthlaspi erraticum]
MASYAMVANLSSWLTNMIIRIMVLKKWKKVGVRDGEGLDVIVVDEAGTKIQASVTKNDYVGMFDYELQEGEWYSLSKFGVVNAPVANRSTKNKWCIIMDSNTEIQKIARRSSSHVIKHCCFDFVVYRSVDFSFPIGWNHVVDGGGIFRFEFDPQFPEAQELKHKFLITYQHTKMSSNYRFYGARCS